MAVYVVQPGDTITSIAFEHGFFPETLWSLEENAALRELRGNPDILFAGDEVFVPALRAGTASVRTGARHLFRRRGVPAKTRLQLWFDGQPRANEGYTLTIDGRSVDGTTDAGGRIEAFIPPNARTGTLVIGADTFPIEFGKLDPITEPSGVRQRLANLGLLGDETPELQLEIAVRRLQRRAGLEETGIADAATLDALVRLHDRPGTPA